MYAFGLNSSGQLGSGNVRSQVTPRPIDALTDVVSVFAGWDQSFCIQSKNEEVSAFYYFEIETRNEQFTDEVTGLGVWGSQQIR